MMADEFVASLKQAAGDYTQAESHPDHERTAAVRVWATVTLRKAPAFEHPPDPVLDLIARYDVSAVRVFQFQFVPMPRPDDTGVWHVATMATDDYFVESGQLLRMYYKEDYPRPTGLTPATFLEVLALRARMIVALPVGVPHAAVAPTLAEYAERALSISPHAAVLDWFGESHAKFEEHRKRGANAP